MNPNEPPLTQIGSGRMPTWSDTASSEPRHETTTASTETMNEVRGYATEMAERTKVKSKSLLAEQKDSAASRVASVAEALRRTAHQMEVEAPNGTDRYLGVAADKLESFSRRMRERDVDSLLADAQDLARRSPVAFFGGTVVAGFLLARFLKSSAAHRASAPSTSPQGSETHGSTSAGVTATPENAGGAYGS